MNEKKIEEYKKKLEEVIAKSNNPERLRAMQWRLEQELNKIKDPVARMNKMVELFWSGVHDFVEVSKSAGTILDNDPPKDPPKEKTKEDNVIDFKNKK